MIGQEFAGFTITRRLATGGMTHLDVGIDQQQNRAVIRRLKSDYIHNRRIRANFMHGAKVLSNLHHPNIVRLLKAGKFKGEPYVATEYLESKNMKDLIFEKSPLLYENVLTMFRQIAAAVNHVHMKGYWHLDIKPENFIVRTDGLAVLIDFDLAVKRKAKPIRLSPMPGTFSYLPPEALQKNEVNDQTDIFSFGVTCYEILTGHKPFQGVTVEDAKRNMIDPRIKPMKISSYQISIPPQLESLIFKCLAKNKDERYPSISLVIRDLETLI